MVEHFIRLMKRECTNPLATIGCTGDRYLGYCNNKLRDHSEIMSSVLGKFFINELYAKVTYDALGESR